MDKLKQLSGKLKPSPRMPVLFVGHGNPMNAILDNDITRTWAKVGKNLPPPQAIVVMSAHWFTEGVRVTDAPKQKIIYDFYGFPDELYQAEYKASGDPEIAKLLAEALLKYEAKLDNTWGLDHGTWSVLRHLAPEPEVPVLQISFDYNQSMDQLVTMFAQLKPLREKGVVFIGSGNLVHNLMRVNWHDDKPYDWALEFDALATKAMNEHNLKDLVRPGRITSAASFAVPTDDHYRPMLAAMALLDPDEQLSYFNDVIELGSVGMRSFVSS